MSADYEQTKFNLGDGPLLDKGEKVLFARAQVSW